MDLVLAASGLRPHVASAVADLLDRGGSSHGEGHKNRRRADVACVTGSGGPTVMGVKGQSPPPTSEEPLFSSCTVPEDRQDDEQERKHLQG